MEKISNRSLTVPVTEMATGTGNGPMIGLNRGGTITGAGSYGKVFINFHIPFSDTTNICFFQTQYFNQDRYGGMFNPSASAIIDLSGEPPSVRLTGCGFPRFSNRNWFGCGY